MNSKIYVDVETNLDEVNAELIDIHDTMMEMVNLAEEMAHLKKEESVFEVDIQGMKFKGTKSDYLVFIDGVIKMGKALQQNIF